MIVVIGSTGQLGTELVKACERFGIGCVGLSHDEIDVTSIHVSRFREIHDKHPSESIAVINTAAYHDLNKCEEHPETAYKVNAVGSENVANACVEYGWKYVYVSTDYCSGTPTDDNGLPRSVYAKTKLIGELAALTLCPDALVVRVGTMYGAAGCRAKGGGNFIDTVVAKIKAQQPFSLPNYTSVLTTYAKHAAHRILDNLEKCGVWYATDEYQPASHYDIGRRVLALLGLTDMIQAISCDPNDHLRPSHTSVLKDRQLHLKQQTDTPIPQYLREKGYL